jgi:hypothetical protein
MGGKYNKMPTAFDYYTMPTYASGVFLVSSGHTSTIIPGSGNSQDSSRLTDGDGDDAGRSVQCYTFIHSQLFVFNDNGMTLNGKTFLFLSGSVLAAPTLKITANYGLIFMRSVSKLSEKCIACASR